MIGNLIFLAFALGAVCVLGFLIVLLGYVLPDMLPEEDGYQTCVEVSYPRDMLPPDDDQQSP